VERVDHLAIVLGMFETGLAVGQSLARHGVRVIGLDHRRDVGFHSRLLSARLCPDPAVDEAGFLATLEELAAREPHRPVLMVASDDFLLPVSRHRERLSKHFLFALPRHELLEAIADKYQQALLAASVGVPVPQTFRGSEVLARLERGEAVPLPVFVKAQEVTAWRRAVSSHHKGWVARDVGELTTLLRDLASRGVASLVQELIPGPDTNHYKACAYVSDDGEVQLAFALRKLRQCPPGFGFGCAVESVEHPEMLELGCRFLKAIGYRGVGSVELKLDPRDHTFKLIELNPRFWQQNGLAARCGMDFGYHVYLDLLRQGPLSPTRYELGVKWVNLNRDFDAFRQYHERGELSLVEWLSSLRGPKIWSDFSLDDPGPGLHSVMARVGVRRRAARWLARMRAQQAEPTEPPRAPTLGPEAQKVVDGVEDARGLAGGSVPTVGPPGYVTKMT
jgi:D-aspartate ligase